MVDPIRMSDYSPEIRSRWLLDSLKHSLMSHDPMHFQDFLEISDSMMEGYARFIRLGLPGQTIGLAMLGATINLFDLFDMGEDLPHLLRGLADKLEEDGEA